MTNNNTKTSRKTKRHFQVGTTRTKEYIYTDEQGTPWDSA